MRRTFTKNHERLIDAQIATTSFDAVLDRTRADNSLSDERFTVDGTLKEAWAKNKSLRLVDDDDKPPTDGGSNPAVDFKGTKRSNATHPSTTDPDARLCRKLEQNIAASVLRRRVDGKPAWIGCRKPRRYCVGHG